LDSETFYSNCKQLLSENGCMTVNIFGRHSNVKESAQKIARLFGNDAVWLFKPTKAGNSILIALRSPRKLDRHALASQAQAIEARWSLPAQQWLKALNPLS
jgi:spermidine synthase